MPSIGHTMPTGANAQDAYKTIAEEGRGARAMMTAAQRHAGRLALDLAATFSPCGRAVAAGVEFHTSLPGLNQALRGASSSDGPAALPSYQTVAALARAVGHIWSPRASKGADAWTAAESFMEGNVGGSVRNAVSLVPLPLPMKAVVIAATLGLDVMQAAHARDPEATQRIMFKSGSDFAV